MRILKKIVKKLYHLIWFLSLFLVFFTPVKAETVTVSYPKLVTSAANLTNGIQCNSTFCVNYNVPVRFDMDFITLWTANSSKTCSSQASISGHINVQGSGELVINPDWLQDNLLRVFLSTNNVDYACNYSIPNGGHIYYTCLVSNLATEFSVGYVFRQRNNLSTYTNTTSIVYRSVDIACSSSGAGNTQEIIDNNTFNTDRVINSQNNNTDRIINDNRKENDKTREKIEDNTDAINGLDDTLNDSSIDSSDNTLNSLKNQLPTNSVISDLLLLPVRLLQSIVNSLGGTCSDFNLGSLYGTNLIMPCIDLQSYLGTSIWTFIDLVFSGMFILVIRKKFIQIWENITNLKGGGNEVD